MRNTAERVRQVRLRAGELSRDRENRLLGGLTFLCAALALSLIGIVGAMTGSWVGSGGTAPDFCGAMLLYEDAGGYVLVGVLSFAAAVLITVLCIRSREKAKRANSSVGESKKKRKSE